MIKENEPTYWTERKMKRPIFSHCQKFWLVSTYLIFKIFIGSHEKHSNKQSHPCWFLLKDPKFCSRSLKAFFEIAPDIALKLWISLNWKSWIFIPFSQRFRNTDLFKHGCDQRALNSQLELSWLKVRLFGECEG